jgi:hypothetical protein
MPNSHGLRYPIVDSQGIDGADLPYSHSELLQHTGFDKVLLYFSNSLYFTIILWGLIASGCVFTAMAPSAYETG